MGRIKILSATGSNIAPNSVALSKHLEMEPSNKSVNAPRQNNEIIKTLFSILKKKSRMASIRPITILAYVK